MGGESTSSSTSVPYEQRIDFTIGNLGWDTDRSTIEARAKEILALLKIKDTEYEGPVAVREKGSLAEVRFGDPAIGSLARLRCKQLRKSYTNGRTVWLDAKKTMAELHPGRMLRQLEKLAKIHESYLDPPGEVTTNLRDMTLSVDTEVVLNARVKPILFTKYGLDRYSDPQRKQMNDTFQN